MASSVTSAHPWRVRRPAPAAAVLGLAALSWLALLMLVASPWASFFGHGALRRLPAHPWMVATMAAGWMLMVGASMLPTTLPLVGLFARLTSGRADRRSLLVILLGSYLVVWLAIGLAMYTGDVGIHAMVGRWTWLAQHLWVISSGALILAGAYQFSGLKSRCLTRCRSPLSILRRHWRGGSVRRQAVRIGLDHGLHCAGCCWALMLVMFSLGVANLVWMVALSILVLIEKGTPMGPRISAPAGIGLLAAAMAAPFAL